MKESKSILFQSITALLIIMLQSCGASGTGEEPPTQKSPPTKAVGVLPANGEPCSDYDEVSSEARALVLFGWNAAQLAQRYEVVVYENGNEAARQGTSALEAKIELDRGKTYTWEVIAINNDGETTSSTYSFTSPGIPIGNYAPYAAEITVEFDSVAMEMSISWVGSDEDGDNLSYDVRVHEAGVLIHESLGQSGTFLEPLPYIPITNYTIEVVSGDDQGSFSNSEINVISIE